MDSSFQFLTLNLPYDTPQTGELLDSEVVINRSSGRFWVAGDFGRPIELGGSCKETLMGPGTNYNTTYIEVSSVEDFPFIIDDPSETPPGIFKRNLFAVKFLGDIDFPSDALVFTQTVNWGMWSVFNGANTINGTPLTSDPLGQLYEQGRTIIFELMCFGPQVEWFGKILWVS